MATARLDPMGPFFTQDTLKFLRALKRNNNREWFNRRKADYERHVRAPRGHVVGVAQPGNEVINRTRSTVGRDPVGRHEKPARIGQVALGRGKNGESQASESSEPPRCRRSGGEQRLWRASDSPPLGGYSRQRADAASQNVRPIGAGRSLHCRAPRRRTRQRTLSIGLAVLFGACDSLPGLSAPRHRWRFPCRCCF